MRVSNAIAFLLISCREVLANSLKMELATDPVVIIKPFDEVTARFTIKTYFRLSEPSGRLNLRLTLPFAANGGVGFYWRQTSAAEACSDVQRYTRQSCLAA